MLLALNGAAAALALLGGLSLPVGQPMDEESASRLSYYELYVLRNEIYAIHGYPFRTPWVRSFFMERDWYRPCKPGPRSGDEPAREISRSEEIQLEVTGSAMRTLGRDLAGCWPVADPDTLDPVYYSGISYDRWPGSLDLPGPYVEQAPLPLMCGPHPGVEEWQRLPDDLCNAVYERSDSILAYIEALGPEACREAAAVTEEILAPWGLGLQDTVYRVYRTGPSPTAPEADPLIVCVEAVLLGSGNWRSMVDPFVLWRLRFDSAGSPVLYEPIGAGADWDRGVAVLALTGARETLRPRAVVYGDIRAMDMMVVEGPFRDLPLVIDLYRVERDGVQRYLELTGY
ncbi:YARHG domain-containing protein [Candidatus Fermentibacterales bacterium]|nr:YARHG domain-containing protein [Candidatus Fermentibacterales bacterium]